MDCVTAAISTERRGGIRAMRPTGALLLAGLLCLCGCREGSAGRRGGRFPADKPVSADRLLQVYGPTLADIECRSTTPGGLFSADVTRMARCAGVTLWAGSSGTLVVGSTGLGEAAATSQTGYRMYLAGRELRDVALGGVYLANVDACLLLGPPSSASFAMDLADPSALTPGSPVAVAYYGFDGRLTAVKGAIEGTGSADAAHVARLIVSLNEPVAPNGGVVFAMRGGGLAGIVSASRQANGALEVIPAANLIRADYWQYTGRRYEISAMLNKLRP